MDHCVFIHTNEKQWLGAVLGQHALRRNSANSDKFDVRIINLKDYPFMHAREGDIYLRDGDKRPWLNDDLQSFTLTADSETVMRGNTLHAKLNQFNITFDKDRGKPALDASVDVILKGRGELTRIETLLEKLDSGPGALPTLLNDEETGRQMRDTIASLNRTAEELSVLVGQLKEGDGLLGRLVTDEELGESVGGNLEELLENLRRLSSRLEEGEGTLAMLIEDPSIYEAINDVIVGIDESKLLRWLVRNRQKSGIKTRYREEQQQFADEGAATVEPSGRP